MASAIANAQARDELRGLAERQGAALRRVATLVAQQATLPAIFNAVAGEASRALGVQRVPVARRGPGRAGRGGPRPGERAEEIRVFSQGLHPALLSRSGLGPSLRALARRSPKSR
jgi:hypothetical protein